MSVGNKTRDVLMLFLYNFLSESRSIVSTVYTPEEGSGETFEVGQGNLKLLYSANEGKLTRYTNNRNSVSWSYCALKLTLESYLQKI